MSEQCYTITPMDHLSLRDGRAFDSSGGRMKGLDWPLPSTLSGALRTRLATRNTSEENPFTRPMIEALKQVHFKGPLPLVDNGGQKTLLFPRPLDLLVKGEDNHPTDIYPLCPQKIDANEGMLLEEGLSPLFPLGMGDEKPFKPMKIDPFWSCEMMERWLAEIPTVRQAKDFFNSESSLAALQSQNRTHVRMDSSKRSHHDGIVFNTSHLDFLVSSTTKRIDQVCMACSIGEAGAFQEALADLKGMGTLGGGRRPVRYDETKQPPRGWHAPETIKKALKDQCYLRMVLATPAIFSQGWKPGWLNGEVLPGGDPSLTFMLKGAAVDRWKPLTGWSYEHPVGSKAIRRMVPAGSVYFLEANRPLTEQDVESLWLRSVCDDAQDRRDGFGLALWGLWKKD